MNTTLWIKILLTIVISTLLDVISVAAQGDGLDHLRKNIPGEPGKDYPIHGPSILCKLNPRQCGGQGGSGNGGKKGNGGKGGATGRKIDGESGATSNNGNEMQGWETGGDTETKNAPALPVTSGNGANGEGSNGNMNSGENGSSGGGDDLDALRRNIPGEPGKDYPINSFSIVCKLNPRQCGGSGGGGNGNKQKGNGNGGNGNKQKSNGNGGNGNKRKSNGNGGNGHKRNGNGNGGNGNKRKGNGNGGNGRKNGNSKKNGNGKTKGKSGNGNSGGDELDALRRNIPGEPGKDYPIHGQSILCKLNPKQCAGKK